MAPFMLFSTFQELVKLTVMDTVFTLMSIFVGDFFRSLFLRVMNPCWFWDMEKNFPKYPDFKVQQNRLKLSRLIAMNQRSPRTFSTSSTTRA